MMAEPGQDISSIDRERLRLSLEAWTKELQAQKGLPVTGITDERTVEAALDTLSKPNLSPETTQLIKTVQGILKLPETGIMDEATKNAVRAAARETIPKPLTDEQKEQARRAELIASPLRQYQALVGGTLPATGVMDDAMKSHFGTLISQMLDTLIEPGKESIVIDAPTALPGQTATKYMITKNGNIHASTGGENFTAQPVGNLFNPENPLAAVISGKALDKLEKDIHDEALNNRLRDIDQTQRRVAGKLTAITGGDPDDVLLLARGSASAGDLARKLKASLNPDNNKDKAAAIDHYSYYLRNLVQAEIGAFNSEKGFFAHDPRYRAAAFANDVITGLSTGTNPDTLHARTEVDVTTLTPVYGRLFDNLELYAIMDPNSRDANRREIGDYQQVIDGGMFGEPGVTANKNYVYEKAVERFEAAARDAGIQPQDITRAMFEGRFNPPM
jgi:hypothetical protein